MRKVSIAKNTHINQAFVKQVFSRFFKKIHFHLDLRTALDGDVLTNILFNQFLKTIKLIL